MKIELNANALRAISEICNKEDLSMDVQLIDDTIDKILDDEPWNDAETLDFVRAFHRMSRRLRTILEAM
ncbi:MAG: hypothetical protein LKE54_04460 [Prevotella sp.]|nr:hypothetical protein [Prevotella sp.]MCH3994295.1 hypothetical protein [Prevotella sp.]